MTRCRRPGCGGVLEDGYCGTCGLAAVREGGSSAAAKAPVPPPPPYRPAPPQPRQGGGQAHGWRQVFQGAAAAAVPVPEVAPEFVGVVAEPWVEPAVGASEPMAIFAEEEHWDPEAGVLAEAVVPEHKRHCCRCDASLKREEGFCGRCGARFSFVPTLRSGDVVADQYEIKGPLAYGGLGWLYLGFDTLLERYVVLKGLLNAQDAAAAVAAVRERRFLAAVKHPHIVSIYNFVQSGGEGFIVMEYVQGRTLKQIRRERGPLPPREALAVIAQVLPALGYLHRMGLLFCDFKPDNVMIEGGRVKLIDLGGVRRVDDPEGDIYGTEGYSAPEAAEGPTVASDLFTVGRCLLVLVCSVPGFCAENRYTLPAELEVLREAPALRTLLERATAADPAMRFGSAEAMATQVEGVLRGVTAQVTGVPQPAVSQLFGPEQSSAQSRRGPDPMGLPRPCVELPGEERARFAAAQGVREPKARVQALVRFAGERETTEPGRLQAGVALWSGGAFAEAQRVCEGVRGGSGWQVRYLRALLAMCAGQAGEASRLLATVYGELPGEPAVVLAMGVAAELSGDLGEAARLYGRVVTVDPGYVSAVFGLARCRAAATDRRGAVQALLRVPAGAAAAGAARTQAVRLLLQSDARGGPPPLGDVQRSAELLETYPWSEEARLRMRREVLATALRLVPKGRRQGKSFRDGAGSVLGCAMDERSLRKGLEATLRALAQMSYGEERVRLVDEANAMRPLSLL